MIDYNTLLDHCQTDDEIAVLVKASSDGRQSLNDMGDRILRRVIARSPDMRSKLTAYNRVYQARYGRVKKGVWPANAPTASQAVELGILDKSDQYITRRYIKAVNTHLELDDSKLKPTRDNIIILDARQQQVRSSQLAILDISNNLVSRKSALQVVIVGDGLLPEVQQQNEDYVRNRVSGFDTIVQSVEGKQQRVQDNKAIRVYRLLHEVLALLEGVE